MVGHQAAFGSDLICNSDLWQSSSWLPGPLYFRSVISSCFTAPDALKAFKMNKSNGGKQHKQWDTIIPESNLDAHYRGQPQSMTTESGDPKGLQSVLKERGYNCSNLKAKCSPVCPFESKNCCMARLLSQQDDFMNQTSMVETDHWSWSCMSFSTKISLWIESDWDGESIIVNHPKQC